MIDQYNTLPTAQNPSSRAAFAGHLELARLWSDYYGRPVHVGEFGCYELADATSRARFYHEMRETMDGPGMGRAPWDWRQESSIGTNSETVRRPECEMPSFQVLMCEWMRPGALHGSCPDESMHGMVVRDRNTPGKPIRVCVGRVLISERCPGVHPSRPNTKGPPTSGRLE